MDVPDELQEMRSAALACSQDSKYAPVERSEHCVFVAEGFLPAYRDECNGARDYDCLNYNYVLSDITDIYNGAIVASLIRFGVPDWAKEEEKVHGSARYVYFDGNLMRSLFEQCLEDEKEQLSKSGLQPAHEVLDLPLAEGQRCYRKGYPMYETTKLEIS